MRVKEEEIGVLMERKGFIRWRGYLSLKKEQLLLMVFLKDKGKGAK